MSAMIWHSDSQPSDRDPVTVIWVEKRWFNRQSFLLYVIVQLHVSAQESKQDNIDDEMGC